jgi:hypothetical protein
VMVGLRNGAGSQYAWTCRENQLSRVVPLLSVAFGVMARDRQTYGFWQSAGGHIATRCKARSLFSSLAANETKSHRFDFDLLMPKFL